MAKIELNLTKNTNEAIEGTYGKYYARVEYKSTIGVKELARHMAEHHSGFSKGQIAGMLTDLVECIKELVLAGNVVKIDDLGLFKVSVDANGLTLAKGSKISAGVGSQRTDAELTAKGDVQQFAVGAVKIIMQATGETTQDEMTRDAKLSFTSKTKALVKQLTGNDAEDAAAPANTNVDDTSGSGTSQSGSGSNSGSGSDNTGGGDNATPHSDQGSENSDSGSGSTDPTDPDDDPPANDH